MTISLNYNNISTQINWGASTGNIIANIDKWPTVSDNIRGYYQVKKTRASIKVRAISKPLYFLKIALLVESPHKDEFDEIFNPISPLNGNSGKKFAKGIIARLGQWFNNANINTGVYNFEIKIINPIQYQTSLYHFLNDKIEYNTYGNFGYNAIDHALRNDVWRFLFERCNLKSNFIDRVKDYSPNYIINCCTGTSCYNHFNANKQIRKMRSGTKNLKALTRESLRSCNLISNVTYLESCHPISWV